MSGRGKGGKAKIQISKPELPSFLQKIKQQIVENEDSDRREQSERKKLRRNQPSSRHDDDDPTIVQLDKDDLTEAEFKRMKADLETKYKLDVDPKEKKPAELNIDDMIKTRVQSGGSEDASHMSRSSKSRQSPIEKLKSEPKLQSKQAAKKLSYDESSSDDDSD